MTRKPDNVRAQSRQIDDNEDRMGQMEELSFRDEDRVARAGDTVSQSDIDQDALAEREREAGLTEASQPGRGPTDDDATPETLIGEDGSRSPEEPGSGPPADKDLTVTNADNIGGGHGPDEAELGRARPLDGKPWDGDESEPLEPRTRVNKDFPAAGQRPDDAVDE